MASIPLPIPPFPSVPSHPFALLHHPSYSGLFPYKVLMVLALRWCWQSVLVLHWALSNYCDYEMNLAWVQSAKKCRNLFVPTILQPVEMESMSDGPRWIVRKLTYIEWPRGYHRQAHREQFTGKIREAIADSGLFFTFRWTFGKHFNARYQTPDRLSVYCSM